MGFNLTWNLVGSVAYALGQWLQLVILAHMGGPAAVGTYAYALAFTAPVMVFASMCLRFLQASDARSAYTFREYLSLRAATTIAAVVLILTMALATGTARGAWLVLLAVCALRAADALSDIYYGLWQRRERMRIIACGMTLNAAGSVALMAAASMLDAGVPGAALGAATGSFAALLFIHWRTASDRELAPAMRSESGAVDWRRVFHLSREAAPLGFTILLGSLQQNVPRFFVQAYAGTAALGVFAAASQLTASADLAGGALAAAAAPRMGAHHANGDARSFRQVTRNLVATGALFGVLGVAFAVVAGRWFLVNVYRPEFASGAQTLVVLSAAAGMALVSSMLGYSLTSARVITIQPVLLTATLGVLVACCFAVVPRWGADGAAWALVGATSVHALGSWIALRRSAWSVGHGIGLIPWMKCSSTVYPSAKFVPFGSRVVPTPNTPPQ
jgi:O-antigen/teichoic acid export membrane protein